MPAPSSFRDLPIDHDVPVPAVAPSKGATLPKYPFDKLRPGDSFLVPCPLSEIKAYRYDIHTLAQQFRRQSLTRSLPPDNRPIDRRFSLRTIRGANGGIRVWRTS